MMMRLIQHTITLTLLAEALTLPAAWADAPRPHETSVRLNGATATVAFSPDGQGQSLVVQAIHEARHTILVQAYGFTNKVILKALVEAHRNGVDVKVILDKSNQSRRYSGVDSTATPRMPQQPKLPTRSGGNVGSAQKRDT